MLQIYTFFLQELFVTPHPDVVPQIIHIFPTLSQVHDHNMHIQSTVKENHHYIKAAHFFSQSEIKPSREVDDQYIPQDDRNAGGLLSCLILSKGTRVMLTSNIYTSQGLVMGYVEHVDINPENDLPRIIYVKFDDESVGKIIQSKENRNGIPIETLQSEFHGGRVIIQEQFPLQPCWGCTIHKLQGTTLERAVVSIGSRVFAKGIS